MNDGNMIQEPPACPVCGLAVEERDPRRGKPLSIHRACRNRRREELRKERERGRRMSQESLLMASRNDVAEAAAELRRRVAWRNEAVGPADHGTVELCYWSVRCMAALMRLEPETLMAVLLQCLFDRFGSVFPQCGLMVFPGVVIVSR